MLKIIKDENKIEFLDCEDIRQKISNTAYFVSEKRDFEGDFALQDWLDAESKIHHQYGKG